MFTTAFGHGVCGREESSTVELILISSPLPLYQETAKGKKPKWGPEPRRTGRRSSSYKERTWLCETPCFPLKASAEEPAVAQAEAVLESFEATVLLPSPTSPELGRWEHEVETKTWDSDALAPDPRGPPLNRRAVSRDCREPLSICFLVLEREPRASRSFGEFSTIDL